jgi:cobalt-zinc-cadmium efflux system membrane fusion protein
MKNIILIFTIVVLLSGCGGKNKTEERVAVAADAMVVSLTDAQLKNAGIVTGKLEEKEISSILKVNGKIDVPPQNMVSISFPLGGYLKHSKLLPGMHVSRGEVLAVMEDMQFIQLQQDYLMAQAKLTYLQPEFQRQKELNREKAASDKILQQTQSDYESQKVLLKGLKAKLNLIGINADNLNEDNISRSVNIYSPIDGYVSTVYVNIGKYVSPTEVLFDVVDPKDIHLNLTVFEKDISRLSVGQQVTAYTNDKPSRKYIADILLIGKNISGERAVEVHCHFDKYDKALLPGMYMNAEIKVSNLQAMVVPEGAVIRWQNEQYVFKADGKNKFIMTKVETGITENGMTEITGPADLYKSDIVLGNAYTLLMKMKNTTEE